MDEEVFRVIPGYDKYCVTKDGVVISMERNLVLSQYKLNGYWIVDTYRGSLTETLPVHRAVALTWVDNPNPEEFTIVNHLDGDPTNNWWKNLEWTDCSGNNYHAIENGLRSDNIRCKVRDFYTKEIKSFDSMAQAAQYMGLRKDSSIYILYPKMYGKLVKDRYEFRFEDDLTPWFYENRDELIQPSRYMVTVKDSNGDEREIYSAKVLMKDYHLYDSPSKSMPGLAQHGNEKHSDKEFIVKDSYAEERYRVNRQTKKSYPVGIMANNGNETMEFSSLTQCAGHFKVDRSSIVNRLQNGKQLDGWTFTQLPL